MRFIHIKKCLQSGSNLFKRMCSMKPKSPVEVHFADGVKTITMSDTRTKNALSLSMMKNLTENLLEKNDDPNLRIIVIEAAGNVFSAGHNLKELSPSFNQVSHQEVFQLASNLMDAIIDSPVPIIAKINGVAAAAGIQLVAQCDLAICTENSTFMTPGVNFGIFCSTPGIALSRTVPKSTAMKMLLTGKAISANEAKSAGLVTEVCKAEDLDSTVNTYCQDIKMKSREVIALGKLFYYKQLNLDIKEAYRVGGNIMVKNLQLQDGKEGITSFIEKRKPSWTHGAK